MRNPFELVTASKLTAEEAVELWCDDKRLDRVKGKENCFINGHRGTGKSMLFRVLQHDCQQLLRPSEDLDFLAIYFSVRDTEFLAEELELFQNDSQKNIISESHFSILVIKQLLILLQNIDSIIPKEESEVLRDLLIKNIQNAYQFSGVSTPTLDAVTFEEFLERSVTVIEQERIRVVHYLGRRLYERVAFDGPLFLFDALLGPIGDFFLNYLGKNLYILIDDGDDLPESYTIVLNTWIARRRDSVVFKVSTMFGYKTFQTRSRSAIQHPHDFFQYDIATRYLSDSIEDYVSLLKSICQKRLKACGIESSPEYFFPEDEEQKANLNKMAESLREEYSKIYTGRSVRDNVYRHLSSEYIKKLVESRSSGDFIYSGFNTLATLSSGLVRDFILCAQKMFDRASRKCEDVTHIPPAIQNTVVRGHADMVLEEIPNHDMKRSRNATKSDWQRIHRLIQGLGSLYKARMLSNASERRVFSFAFQDEAGEDLDRLLDLAVAEGYLMKGFISRKEGTGRRILYVLTRRVAPAFNLDVSSYSGYLSLTTDRVRSLLDRGAERCDIDTSFQLDLFPDTEWMIISPEEAGL